MCDLTYSKLPRVTQDVDDLGPLSTCKERDISKFLENMVKSSKQKAERLKQIQRVPLKLVSHKKQNIKRNQRTVLSLKERRELGLYKLQRKGMKYKDFLPLHDLWKQYFTAYMELDALKQHGFTGRPEDRQYEAVSVKLLKADYHGAILTVKKSLNYSLVGKRGIVVFDTKNTFQLLDEDNKLRKPSHRNRRIVTVRAVDGVVIKSRVQINCVKVIIKDWEPTV